MSSSADALGRISSVQVPGLFDIAEQDDAYDVEPHTISSLRTRAGDDLLRPDRWRALVDRLRGYRLTEVLVDREPVWFPLIDLHAPPGGSSTFTYTASSDRTNSLELTVLGSGFGRSTKFTFHDSIGLSATTTGKTVRTRLLFSASRYLNRDGDEILRVDLQDPDVEEHHVADLPLAISPDLTDPSWRVVRRERLRGLQDSGSMSWTHTAGSEARWNARLGVALPGLGGSGTSLGVNAAGCEEVSVAFNLPYGKDYVFYVPSREVPLAPRVAVEE